MKDHNDADKIRFTPDVMYANERDELLQFAEEQFAMLFDLIHLAKVGGSNSMGGGNAKVTTIGKTTRATVTTMDRIQATLAEVKDIYFSDHTVFATGFAQSQQIHSLLTPSNNHPMRSSAVRWSLWDTPSKVVRKRDIVYLEYMDAFTTDDGRRGWARCTHSIDHRSCPPLTNSHSIVRAHLYCSGTVYTEAANEPGMLDVVTLFDVDTRGIPAWMSKTIALKKAQTATQVEHLIRLSRVMTDEGDPDVKLIEFHVKGKVCHGCGDRVSMWSTTTRKCRDCKEPLCKSCCEVVYYNADERKKLKNICVYCVDEAISEGDSHRGGNIYSGCLDAINEKSTHVHRRMHHMSFRSLRMSHDINVSLSPTSTDRFSMLASSHSASRSPQFTVSRAVLRRESDPGVSLRAFSRAHGAPSSPALRSSQSVVA